MDIPFTIDGQVRQQRTHTCFKNCIDYDQDKLKFLYLKDTRPLCDGYADKDKFIICVEPAPFDSCEQTVLAEELGDRASFSFAVTKAILAVFIASPIQFLYDLLCIYLVKIKVNQDKASENCKLMSFQLFMVITSFYLMFHTIHIVFLVQSYGRP